MKQIYVRKPREDRTMRYINYFSCFYLLNNFMKLDRVVSKHAVYYNNIFNIEKMLVVSLVVFGCLFQNQCNFLK